MSIAVISDVHANIEALESVLNDIRKKNIERILFLGDAVGYGPDPNEAIKILKESSSVLLAGNHDWGAIGLTDIEYFNPNAKKAIIWTAEVLSDESKTALRGFPLTMRLPDENVFLVHSTPKNPEQWHYLLTYNDALENLAYFTEGVCFVGHSHLPFILERTPSGEMKTHTGSAELNNLGRYVINAGSVGQPRDRDPRACYAILGEGRVELMRVDYPFEDTQRKMKEVGLPEPLIERLAFGR